MLWQPGDVFPFINGEAKACFFRKALDHDSSCLLGCFYPNVISVSGAGVRVTVAGMGVWCVAGASVFFHLIG